MGQDCPQPGTMSHSSRGDENDDLDDARKKVNDEESAYMSERNSSHDPVYTARLKPYASLKRKRRKVQSHPKVQEIVEEINNKKSHVSRREAEEKNIRENNKSYESPSSDSDEEPVDACGKKRKRKKKRRSSCCPPKKRKKRKRSCKKRKRRRSKRRKKKRC